MQNTVRTEGKVRGAHFHVASIPPQFLEVRRRTWGELPANIEYGNTHGVCEDSQGRIYIHHTVNAASESHDTMVVYDAKGKFVKSWCQGK